MNDPKPVQECVTCDFENARRVGRATWLCPKCGRDFSIAYLFWAQAVRPEWFDQPKEKVNE